MSAASGLQGRARSPPRTEAHRKCRVLRESSFHGQVCFLVLVISPRVLVDTGHLLFRQWRSTRAGRPRTRLRGGITVRSVINAPAPTIEYSPTTTSLSRVARIPIRQWDSIVQPCIVTPWPTVT